MVVSTSLDSNGNGGLSMGFPFAIVVCYLDGTLLDTLGDLAAAVNHTLGLMDRAPLAEAAVRPMIGRGAKHMLEEGLRASGGVPDGAVERLYPELLDFYEAHIAVHSRPFPGVRSEEHTSELQSLMR